jgi:hypothetical protein
VCCVQSMSRRPSSKVHTRRGASMHCMVLTTSKHCPGSTTTPTQPGPHIETMEQEVQRPACTAAWRAGNELGRAPHAAHQPAAPARQPQCCCCCC